MLERDILIGGEESGGIGIRRLLPERDGMLNSLLLADIMAEEGKPLGQLVERSAKEYGATITVAPICTSITKSKKTPYAVPGRSQRSMGSFNVLVSGRSTA